GQRDWRRNQSARRGGCTAGRHCSRRRRRGWRPTRCKDGTILREVGRLFWRRNGGRRDGNDVMLGSSGGLLESCGEGAMRGSVLV
ncbi:hypothetical protein ID866_5745, partial [Astraeus odoratus]